MNNRHLTEEEIQSYLDRDESVDLQDFEQHLKSCRRCQLELASYRKLYSCLSEDTGFNLSRGFVQRIISKTIESQPEESRGFYKDLALGLTGLLSALGILLFFTDIGQLLGFAVGFQQNQIILFRSFVGEIITYIQDLSADAHLLTYVTLILVVIALLDYAVKRNKKIRYHIL